MAERIVIVSGKGGAGKSTAAVLLGRGLASAGVRVLLVDADVGLNALEILTASAEQTVFHWGDVILGRCAVGDCVVDCGNGLFRVGAPTAHGAEQTPEAFDRVIGSLDGSYDFILIDGPAGIGEGMRLAAAPAKKALLLSAPDDVSVSGCARAAAEVMRAGPTQTRLIINRFRVKAVRKCRQINIDDVIDRAGVRLIGIVPEDKNLWYFGSGGLLPKSSSAATRACDRIAARLMGRQVPLNLSELK